MTRGSGSLVGRTGCSEWPDADRLAGAHERYAATRDPAVRAELIDQYTGLVRSVARRFAGRGEAAEDLQQVAFVGLLEALERFDADRGVPFLTYAVPTMVGHLKRHFRDCRWRVHISRALQERYLDIRTVRDELIQELGRQPTVSDIAAALGLGADEVVEAMEAGATFSMDSLESLGGAGSWAWSSRAETGYRTVDNRLLLQSLVARLSEQQQQVLTLRFAEGLTQAEIGQRIGTSQMQVSRLLSRSLGILRRLAERSGARE